MSDPVKRLNIRQLEERLALSRQTIWRYLKAAAFPTPHFVGERRAWFERDVLAWEKKRMARPASARGGGIQNLGTSIPTHNPPA